MKVTAVLTTIGGILTTAILANVPSASDVNIFDGAAAWHASLQGKAMNRSMNSTTYHGHHRNRTYHPGHNVEHDHDPPSKRGTVIDTIFPTDTGDMHWHVAVWKTLNCVGPSYEAFSDYTFMSSHCMRIPEKVASFALKGNVNNCVHEWYWDCDCSDPAELSAVMGDVWCYNGPGAQGQEQIGSFRITCDGSVGGA
jgi:hypothetical protein